MCNLFRKMVNFAGSGMSSADQLRRIQKPYRAGFDNHEVMLILYETDEDAQQAANDLSSLGGHALKLLAECVGHQGLKRKSASAAAKALEDAGFVIIKHGDGFVDCGVGIIPCGAGEEALDILEQREATH